MTLGNTALHVLHALTRGPQTGSQLRESLQLPRRTLYGALQRLIALGFITERVSLRDARRRVYTVVHHA